jgi:1-deoxy-D-xylulose 5-phosphate reductoisomerase
MKPDYAKYPCIELAYQAGWRDYDCRSQCGQRGSERIVQEDAGLGFRYSKTNQSAMEAHKEDLKTKLDVTLDDILNCDAWARQMFSPKVKVKYEDQMFVREIE